MAHDNAYAQITVIPPPSMASPAYQQQQNHGYGASAPSTPGGTPLSPASRQNLMDEIGNSYVYVLGS